MIESCLVSFYLEVWGFGDIEVKDKKGTLMECQESLHIHVGINKFL